MALNVEFNRQSKRVKVTPDTTMFQVLAVARDQHGLSDSRQYQLLHRSKPIDLSIPFSLTGISNNASLEIKELEETGELEQVRVCMQLRDGKRVQACFGSNATMEHILTFFKLMPAQEQFSLGFLRREIKSHAFATTTLKELGISRGSAMFRIQAVDESISSASPSVQGFPVSKEESSTPHQPDVIITRTSSSTPSNPPAPASELPSRHLAPQPEDVEMKESFDEARLSDMIDVMSSRGALQLLRDNSFDAVSRIAVTTLMKVITNILSDPENDRLRSIRLSNPVFRRSVGQVKGGLEFLKSVGFTVTSESQMLALPSFYNKRLLEEGLCQLNFEADALDISPDMRPAVCKRKEDSSFDIYKPQITRVQMQPRGLCTTEILVDALKCKQHELAGHEKPPRNTIVALGGRRSSVQIATNDERSEQYDAQLLMSSLKARRKEMERKENFQTRAMRELDELKRKKVYQTALIRIHFPDHAIIQASFHPDETVQDVMDHVTDCLAEQFNASMFYLYISPPTQKLNVTKTLNELNLVPAALTYLSWLEVPQAETESIGYYLRRDLVVNELAEIKDSVDLLQRVVLPQPVQYEMSSNIETQVEPTQRSPLSAQTKAAKKPSWLKL